MCTFVWNTYTHTHLQRIRTFKLWCTDTLVGVDEIPAGGVVLAGGRHTLIVLLFTVQAMVALMGHKIAYILMSLSFLRSRSFCCIADAHGWSFHLWRRGFCLRTPKFCEKHDRNSALHFSVSHFHVQSFILIAKSSGVVAFGGAMGLACLQNNHRYQLYLSWKCNTNSAASCLLMVVRAEREYCTIIASTWSGFTLWALLSKLVRPESHSLNSFMLGKLLCDVILH